MSIFKNIELDIESVSKELNAIISKDRPSSPQSLRTFEERRIDWEDNGIKKAIIIQPTFELEGVNSNLWNFTIVAWKGISKKRVYLKKVIEKSDFINIESNIKELLKAGKEILINIKDEDLK